MAIETMLDINDMSVDELIGRLKAAEERYGLNGGGGGSMASLNLTKEELVAKVMSRLQLSGDGCSGGGKTPSTNQRRWCAGGVSQGGGSSSDGKSPAGGKGKKKKKAIAGDECRYCGIAGH